MPIANTPLTKTEFEFLQQNITDQIDTVTEAGLIAQSGLHYVVLLQVDAPEVDLVNPFFFQLQRTEQLAATTNWIPAVSSLNSHAVTRGASATGTLSERLNEYLENGGNRILVSQTYANLSAVAGYIIDPCNIDPGTAGSCLPGITSDLVAAGSVSAPFSYFITAVGTPTMVYSITLPVGLTALSVNSSTGKITGTPVGSLGAYNITITATNSVGAASKTLVFTLSA